jgi:hypothetical protein
MPETATYSIRTRFSTGEFRPRILTWISNEHFQGPGCSRCAWLFRPSGPPIGNSLMEMKENYIRSCNGEFAKHVCTEHPRATTHRDRAATAQKALHRDTRSRSLSRTLPAGRSS